MLGAGSEGEAGSGAAAGTGDGSTMTPFALMSSGVADGALAATGAAVGFCTGCGALARDSGLAAIRLPAM